ncbi:hypothetical protein M2150_002704 [Lachnospiraceae bacterium PM6-15]|uniref:hypothetical protein n=1 Tax=Ohessyouella blattaphilus TaxID=2949333 RepID=UPI003E1D50AD
MSEKEKAVMELWDSVKEIKSEAHFEKCRLVLMSVSRKDVELEKFIKILFEQAKAKRPLLIAETQNP